MEITTVCPKQFALRTFLKNQWSDCQNSKRNAFLYAKTHIWPVPKLKGHQGHRWLRKRLNTGFLDLTFEPLVRFCWNFGTKHISGVKFLTTKFLHEVAWFSDQSWRQLARFHFSWLCQTRGSIRTKKWILTPKKLHLIILTQNFEILEFEIFGSILWGAIFGWPKFIFWSILTPLSGKAMRN